MRKGRIPPPRPFVSLSALALCALLAACGGGSSNSLSPGIAPAAPVPPPSTTDASVQVPFASANISTSLPPVAGYGENITLPSNDAPLGSTLSVTVSLSAHGLPAAAPSLPAATTMLYFTAKSAQTVTLQAHPAFSITVPASVQLTGEPQVQLASYDPAKGWSELGTGTIAGRTITIDGAHGTNTMKAGTTYGFVIYSENLIAGCPTPTPSPTPTPTAKPTATPTARPTATPTPVPTTTPKPQSLYVSNVNGNLSDSMGYINNVLVFGPGASGNVAPARKVNVPGTGCNGGGGITGIALDSSANLYVGEDTECLNNGSGGTWVRIYAPTASGDAAWTREIASNLPDGLAIDNLDNLYVGNGNGASDAVTVYSKGASSPSRTITGSNTMFGNNGIMGVAVNSTGTKLAVSVNNANSCNGMYVLVFAASANGNVAPSRDLGQPCYPNYPYGAAFDKSGNLYVAGTYSNQIFIYSPSAPNSSAPTATIGGTNTALNNPTGVVVDNKGDLFVANQGSDSITEYAPGARGNATPIKTISGSNTGLTQPTYLAIGP